MNIIVEPIKLVKFVTNSHLPNEHHEDRVTTGRLLCFKT